MAKEAYFETRILGAKSLESLCRGRAPKQAAINSYRNLGESQLQIEIEEAVKMVRGGRSIDYVAEQMANPVRGKSYWHRLLVDMALQGNLYREKR